MQNLFNLILQHARRKRPILRMLHKLIFSFSSADRRLTENIIKVRGAFLNSREFPSAS